MKNSATVKRTILNGIRISVLTWDILSGIYWILATAWIAIQEYRNDIFGVVPDYQHAFNYSLDIAILLALGSIASESISILAGLVTGAITVPAIMVLGKRVSRYVTSVVGLALGFGFAWLGQTMLWITRPSFGSGFGDWFLGTHAEFIAIPVCTLLGWMLHPTNGFKATKSESSR